MKENVKEKNSSIYEIVSENRGTIMGLAIIWVMFFHANVGIKNDTFRFLKEIGYGGVDIFLFCSGFGIAHSLQKNGYGTYIKNRFWKILPSYYLFLIGYFYYRIYIAGAEVMIRDVIGNITMTGWWSGCSNQFNWYMQILFIFYFTAPFAYYLILETSYKKTALTGLILAGLLAGYSFSGDGHLMAVSRFPILFIGIFVGTARKQEKEINWKTLLLSMVVLLAGLRILFIALYSNQELQWTYGTCWYPFAVIAPSLCVLSGYLLHRIKKYPVLKQICKILVILGNASFEIYLIHITVFEYLADSMAMSNGKWYLAMVLCTLFAVLFHKLVSEATNALRQCPKCPGNGTGKAIAQML